MLVKLKMNNFGYFALKPASPLLSNKNKKIALALTVLMGICTLGVGHLISSAIYVIRKPDMSALLSKIDKFAPSAIDPTLSDIPPQKLKKTQPEIKKEIKVDETQIEKKSEISVDDAIPPAVVIPLSAKTDDKESNQITPNEISRLLPDLNLSVDSHVEKFVIENVTALLNQKNKCVFLKNLSSSEIFALCQKPMNSSEILKEGIYPNRGRDGVITGYRQNEVVFATKQGSQSGVLNDWRVGEKLDHPNFMKVYFHLCDQQGNTLIFMDFVEGITLDNSKIDWSPSIFTSIVKQLAVSLKYLLEKNITPRDLKANNMMMTHDGTLKMIDFGEYMDEFDGMYFVLNTWKAIEDLTHYYLAYCKKNASSTALINSVEEFKKVTEQQIGSCFKTTIKTKEDIKNYLNQLHDTMESLIQ